MSRPPTGLQISRPTPEFSWIFKKTGLIGLFPTWPWARITHYLYWALRLSPIGLFLLLFVVYRIGRRRRPDVEYPEVPEGLTTLPSNLPAPVVSVLDRRAVGPQTYLSILVDLLQKGNLTITGTYDNSRLSRTDQEFHSDVTLTRQFEPDQPWEKEVYDAIHRNRTDAGALLSRLERRKDAISRHLDTHLLSRGIFPGPTPSGTRGTGCLVLSGAFMGAVFVALGVGLWVNFWLPWWAGAAIGILPAAVFFFVALPDPEPHIPPTPAGALEISRWRAFRQSLRNGLVSPISGPQPTRPPVALCGGPGRCGNSGSTTVKQCRPGFSPAETGNRPGRASMRPTAASSAPTHGGCPEAPMSRDSPRPPEATTVTVPKVPANPSPASRPHRFPLDRRGMGPSPNLPQYHPVLRGPGAHQVQGTPFRWLGHGSPAASSHQWPPPLPGPVGSPIAPTG